MSDGPTDPESPAARAARLGVEVAPAVLLLGFLLWQVREILSPLVLYPLLCLLLWPQRRQSLVARFLVVTGLLTLVWFLYTVGALLAPFLLALGIAYLLAPAVDVLQRQRVLRSVAIAITLLPFLALLVLLVLLLVPAIERQITELAGRLPDLTRRVADWLLSLRTRLLESSGGLLSEAQAQRLRELQPADLVSLVNDQWEAIARRVWRALLGIGKGFSVVLTVLGYAVVTPVVTYYLLRSWHPLTARVEALVPPARRPAFLAFLGEYNTALGRYVRGQLIEATLVAVATGGALAVLGFPGAILVGVVAGVGNLIPYVGMPLSLIPGLLLALVSPAVWPALFKLGVVFGVVQFVDGSITGPRIVGEAVGLNPVWVILALALFGSLLGFVGLLLAVPIAVLVKMLAARAIRRYQASAVYTAA